MIHGYIQIYPWLQLIQDRAPGHTAADTVADLRERGFHVFTWPPYSPDLNPIERYWHWMKNYLQENYPEKMGYDRLREAVSKAWEETVIEEKLEELISSMGAR